MPEEHEYENEEACFLSIRKREYEIAQKLILLLTFRMVAGVGKGKDHIAKSHEQTSMDFASVLTAVRQQREDLVDSVLENIIGREAGDISAHPQALVRVDQLLTREDMEHLESLRDDPASIEIFLRSRPQIIKALKDGGMDVDRAIKATVKGLARK